MSDANSLENSRAVLSRDSSTMTQLVQAITHLENTGCTRQIKIGLSGAVTIDLLGTYLRKHAALAATQAILVSGNYDDPISDTEHFVRTGVELMVLVPFFDNILPAFEAQIPHLDPSFIEEKLGELRQRFRLVFQKSQALKQLLVLQYHRIFPALNANDPIAVLIERCNTLIAEEARAFSHVRLLDSEALVRHIGSQRAFDFRFYYRSKAPYSTLMMDRIAEKIADATRNFGTHFYKVLVLDCDNTLWGGIIGEDLMNGIKLNPYDYPGNIFWRIQHEIVNLENNGLLICLCSKNNPQDVDEVWRQHPHRVLQDKHIVAKKVNWQDKASNIRALAQELNLGLDSFIFVDDSSFECEAVRQQLPMVKTLQVPKALPEYPQLFEEIKRLCLAGGIASDSRGKTEAYRQRAAAEDLKAQFDSQEDYLASLELKVEITRNARESIARISELSQKSNQFNLTTRRFTPSEIEDRMQRHDSTVYSLVVRDKFGDSGLTGVALVHYDGPTARIDNFFMSCRVIGRGVEFCLWSHIVQDALQHGCQTLIAEFAPSAKNAQVADFYDRLGLPLIEIDASGKRTYALPCQAFSPPDNHWIEVTYVG